MQYTAMNMYLIRMSRAYILGDPIFTTYACEGRQNCVDSTDTNGHPVYPSKVADKSTCPTCMYHPLCTLHAGLV